jgi:hypothetical protein
MCPVSQGEGTVYSHTVKGESITEHSAPDGPVNRVTAQCSPSRLATCASWLVNKVEKLFCLPPFILSLSLCPVQNHISQYFMNYVTVGARTLDPTVKFRMRSAKYTGYLI